MLDTKARELKGEAGGSGPRACRSRGVRGEGGAVTRRVRGEGGAVTQNPCRFSVDSRAGRKGANQGGG